MRLGVCFLRGPGTFFASSCSQQRRRHQYQLSSGYCVLASLSEDPQSQVSKTDPSQILPLHTSSHQTRLEPPSKDRAGDRARKRPPPVLLPSSPPTAIPSLILEPVGFSSFLRPSFFCICTSLPPPTSPPTSPSPEQHAGPGAGPELHDALHLRFLGFFHYHTPTLNSKPVASAVSQVTQQLLIGGAGYPSTCTLSLFHSLSFQQLCPLESL